MSQFSGVKKPVRSVSGVTPLTVVLKPRKCDHGTCIFCPGGDYVPQSYTDKSPAIMRALAFKFDPHEQVKSRLNALIAMGHPTDKIEVIVLGGTFLQYEIDYQYSFIKACYDALNGKESKDLEEAKKINETSEHRCVAMCIENRPDNCSSEEIERMLEYGATRVEIGIQILDDEIYRKINRGHKVQDVIDATKNLKNAGFKLGYHVMPGLPFSNPEKDIELFKKIFEDNDFKPDQLKIYPCQIVEDSPLAKIYKKIGYEPYPEEVTKKLVQEMMTIIPEYCRVMRIMREFPKEKVIGSPTTLEMRKGLEEEFRKKGVKIKEIRMREIGFNMNTSSRLGQSREIGFNKLNDENLKLRILEYGASEGKEYFLEIVNDEDVLFGLLRLRIFDETSPTTISPTTRPKNVNDKTQENFVNLNDNVNDETKSNGIKNSQASLASLNLSMTKRAIVRELHVYGQVLSLGVKGEIGQHKGFGRWLMDEAEKITREKGIDELAVISGIGVRQYYEKLGYGLKGYYMVKKINV